MDTQHTSGFNHRHGQTDVPVSQPTGLVHSYWGQKKPFSTQSSKIIHSFLAEDADVANKSRARPGRSWLVSLCRTAGSRSLTHFQTHMSSGVPITWCRSNVLACSTSEIRYTRSELQRGIPEQGWIQSKSSWVRMLGSR